MAQHDLVPYPRDHNVSPAEWCQSIQDKIHQWGGKPEDVTISYTGGPAFAEDIRGSVKRDMLITILISAVFSTLLFWFAVRDGRLIRLQAFMIATILVLTFGLGLFFFGQMSLMCVGFASILIGLAVDYGMILCNHGRKGNRETNRRLSKGC